MNDNFSQEQRDLHGTNIYNMLVRDSIVSFLKLKLTAKF